MSRDDDYAAYVNARWATLVRTALLLGCSPPEAEDLVQTVLVRCYVSWERVMRADDRDAYVYRMLVNGHASSRRRRWWREYPTDELQPETYVDEFGRADLGDSVRRALQSLGEPARAIVVLRFYLDLSERQTASILAIPVGTVKSRLYRALRQLAEDPHLINLSGGEP